MCKELQGICRYFVTYSGVKLPLKLSQALDEDALSNRNTFFRAYFDDQERMTGVQKIVYGEVELEHRYAYYSNGTLKQAVVIDAEEEATMLYFDEAGKHKTNK
ncbi:MAG: DUF6156 family protein [Methylotenera sp.]|nr:DUF6156 family protein [Methylotenera sp.]